MSDVSKVERTLERWGAAGWAWVFRPAREPVEVVAVLRRECDENALILGRGRVLVPNSFVVALPPCTHHELDPYTAWVGPELADRVREHATRRRYSFAGPVTVSLRTLPELAAGRYSIRSRIAPAEDEPGS
ncbi:DUF3662 domain-containing protein [Streptomyces sp. NPDC003016]